MTKLKRLPDMRKWSGAEDKYLIENWRSVSPAAIARRLTRSYEGVRYRHGLLRRKGKITLTFGAYFKNQQ